MPIYQLSPGDIFDEKYRVEQQLGQGGMAIVYRVTELGEVDTEHALKLIRLPSFPSEEALAIAKDRFRQEAAIQAKMRHPHIVGVHRYDVAADGTPYLLMELLDGEDLGAVLKRVPVLPWASALAVVEQASLALTVLHKAGLVHRDLSPGNIFLVHHGAPPPEGVIFVKLLDFGIAKRGTDPHAAATAPLTNPSLRIGNPPYMAPECIVRKRRKRTPPGGNNPETEDEPESFDGRADEFSLASIFFEMLAGRKAFLPKGADPTQAFGLVLNADPLEDELPATFTPAVCAVLGRALSKDPDARYDTVLDFVAALRAAGPGHDASAAAATDLEQGGARPFSHAGSGLSPRFVMLTGLVAVVALLCLSAYERPLREALERLGLIKERQMVSHVDVPWSPPAPGASPRVPPVPPPALRDGGSPEAARPDAAVREVKPPVVINPPPGTSNDETLSPGEKHPPKSPKYVFSHTYADARQKERAAPALETFHRLITSCLKRQRSWTQIEIIAMVRLHAAGLSSGTANQDLSNCLNDSMPASAVAPKRTFVTRAR